MDPVQNTILTMSPPAASELERGRRCFVGGGHCAISSHPPAYHTHLGA